MRVTTLAANAAGEKCGSRVLQVCDGFHRTVLSNHQDPLDLLVLLPREGLVARFLGENGIVIGVHVGNIVSPLQAPFLKLGNRGRCFHSPFPPGSFGHLLRKALPILQDLAWSLLRHHTEADFTHLGRSLFLLRPRCLIRLRRASSCAPDSGEGGTSSAGGADWHPIQNATISPAVTLAHNPEIRLICPSFLSVPVSASPSRIDAPKSDSLLFQACRIPLDVSKSEISNCSLPHPEQSGPHPPPWQSLQPADTLRPNPNRKERMATFWSGKGFSHRCRWVYRLAFDGSLVRSWSGCARHDPLQQPKDWGCLEEFESGSSRKARGRRAILPTPCCGFSCGGMRHGLSSRGIDRNPVLLRGS